MKKIILSIIYFLACIFSIQAQVLYGTTFNGGDGGGTIIKFLPATNSVIPVHSFESSTALPTNFIQANDGKLYGITAAGGSINAGTIFSFDPSSSTYTRLKDFDIFNGSAPHGSLLQARDGKLYGMTSTGGSSFSYGISEGYGVIFSWDPQTSTYVKLKDFDFSDGGGKPQGSLVQAKDGKLYGMTTGSGSGGIIFSYDPISMTYKKLRNFVIASGSGPYGSLIQAKDGKLYGMTSIGGTSGKGVIFSFDPLSSIYTDLIDFNTSNGERPLGSLMEASDGKLYGMTTAGGSLQSGIIFSFDPSSLTYVKLKDFDNRVNNGPRGDLIQASDGKIYGMTASEGISRAGNIFSFDPLSSAYANLFEFTVSSNGTNPNGTLLQASDGKLYGMTMVGGAFQAGVIFRFDPASFSYQNLRDFGNANGSNPVGSLVQAVNGKLYGLTQAGGSNQAGVLYSFDPSSSTYSKLVDFGSETTKGMTPVGNSLVQATDGKLYGMTTYGGEYGYGVIFSYDPLTSAYTPLKDIDDIIYAMPYGSLIQGSDGNLYGLGRGATYRVTSGGIFVFDPSSLNFGSVINLQNSGLSDPNGNLLQGSDGKMYGMVSLGGSGGAGVIFSFDPMTGTFTNLKDFDGTNGAFPQGSFIQATDGKLYGMTEQGGSAGNGVIFSFDPSSSTFIKLQDFDVNNGANPFGNLFQATDGKMYGMTNAGGKSSLGVIFSFDPLTATYTKLIDYNGRNGANGGVQSHQNYGSAFIELKECITDTAWYKDGDSDGYGNADSSLKACSQPAGYVKDSTDCDDTKASIHPGAKEICGNGIDDNCNGQIDENCQAGVTVSINDVQVKESKGVAVLTVTLSGKNTKPVWLLYYTKDGTAISRGWHKDYETRIGWLYIRPGALTASVYIRIINDKIAEPTEYFDVILFKSLNATIADGSGRVFISDDKPCNNPKLGFMQDTEISATNGLEIKVMPNPSASQFNITIQSNDRTSVIDMKVMDVQGKLMEVRNNIISGQTLRIGSNYRPGTYFIQAVQGKQRVTSTVVKLSQ